MSDHGVGILAPGVDFRGHQSGTGGTTSNLPRQTMKTPTPAQRDYAARQVRAKALLASIGTALEAHAKKIAGQPENWAFTGDLSAVEDRLQEILEYFGK